MRGGAGAQQPRAGAVSLSALSQLQAPAVERGSAQHGLWSVDRLLPRAALLAAEGYGFLRSMYFRKMALALFISLLKESRSSVILGISPALLTAFRVRNSKPLL